MRDHPGFVVDPASGRIAVRSAAQPPALVAAPPRSGSRLYSGARNTRNTYGFGGVSSSADAELMTSLAVLRNRSRQMVRDSAYARRARQLVVDNVIGSGMGMQARVLAERGGFRTAVNAAIEREYETWCEAENCHTGGVLHFGDLERAALGQVFEAGDVLIRAHDFAFGSSRVPLALELIESERLADGMADPGAMTPGAEIRMGIEVEGRFKRPIAAWIRRQHPGDIRGAFGAADEIERVPASQLYHLRLVTRWPQTRGEPWLCATVRKLDDMSETSQLEITAARGAAAYFATITSSEQGPTVDDDEEDDGTRVMSLDPLTIQQLREGEQLQFHAPNRPNAALDPFMRFMLREVAAGTGVSYASLSSDYSQSNYSSSRLALLDDRALWRVLQQWWMRAFRLPLHRRWLRQAVLSGAVEVPATEYLLNTRKFEAVRFKPRGWNWIDPTKEVDAYNEAIEGGLTTRSDVIAATGEGRDYEDYLQTLKLEQGLEAEAKAAGVKLPWEQPKPVQTSAPRKPAAADGGGEDGAPADDAGRVLPIRPRSGGAVA